jgi:serine/threonine protein kinase
MEYCDGGSLDQKLLKMKEKPLPLVMSKSIIYQILKGLKYLHENNVIHRDLKPGNILMDITQKHFKIADFGVATEVIGKNSNTKRTETGTAWYMAPEVFKSEAYSYPIDIWAVG